MGCLARGQGGAREGKALAPARKAPARKARRRAQRSLAERAFELAWRIAAPPLPGECTLESEFLFHPERKWRFDFAFPAHKVAIEIDGRARGKPDAVGRHQTVDGVRRDLEKHRAAVRRGWRVLRYPATDKGDAPAWVRETRELLGTIAPNLARCSVCECTDEDCSQCVERTGEPCYWARPGLCSACADRMKPAPAGRVRLSSRD